ncbi:ATP-dependent endonuclease, partial [Mesorhizobium sp. M2A.F.Ca.ET.046.02.1.1]
MNAPIKPLADDAARRAAITVHDRSILVEAGAGSGKTAVMAGRIAMMLAEGIAPKTIAAVTFTELAASELLMRVREFVSDLAAGQIPSELRVALPYGLSDRHRENLATASAAIDEITCSTIHGFCQRVIKPYPVEADIDPGAAVMDRDQADLSFIEIVETWLRDELAGDEGSLIAEMVLQNPAETVGLIHKILVHLRGRRTVSADAAAPLPPMIDSFRRKAAAFVAFMRTSPADEEETATIAARFGEMAESLGFALTAEEPANHVRLLFARPHSDLCTKAGGFRAFNKKGKWVNAAKRAGLAKADGERLNAAADTHYGDCCEAWD